MAIQKRFIHFKKFSDFNSKKLSANEANTQYTVGVSGEIQNGEPDILYQSYCWIKDTKQQWTHAQLYGSSTSEANVQAVDIGESVEDVNTNTYVKYVAQTLTEEQKAQVRSNIGVESGSSVQPDWNETDTSSAAYIKHKPNISMPDDETILIYSNNSQNQIILDSHSLEISLGPTNKIVRLENNGDSSKFLSGDGSYKSIDIPVIVNTTNAQTINATIKPNTYYVFKYGTESLNITLEAPTNTAVLNNYMFEFVTSHGTSLTLPSDIKWINDEAPVLELNNTYQVSIINNLATIAKYRYDEPTDL